MVHTAAAYARQKNRLQTLACTSSIGPGATNLVTGAALATINRLPVLLLPGDVFATRAPGTVLQELEDPTTYIDLGQRHAQARLPLLGPHRAPRAAHARAAGRDARADRPGGDRRGHARAAPGRAGRGLRLAGGAVREARLADPAPGPRARRAARRGRTAPHGPQPADRRRRRDDLRRGDRGAAGARRGHRDRRRRDPGRQGLAPLRPSAGARRDRRHRHDRGQRRGPRGRRDPRRRHPLERLHDGVPQSLQLRRPLHQPQRRRRRRLQARRACRSSPTPATASRRSTRRWTSASPRPPTTGTRRSSARTRRSTSRPRRPR